MVWKKSHLTWVADGVAPSARRYRTQPHDTSAEHPTATVVSTVDPSLPVRRKGKWLRPPTA
jgi:hypothetical protein